MKNILFLITIATVLISANNIHGKNPKSNSNNYSKFFEYEKNIQRKVDIDFDNYKEKVQNVNISELEGKTFLLAGKAFIILERNVLYVGILNAEGRIDLEKKLRYKTLDDNCITIDSGKTCFTIRSKTMLPEIINPKTGKTLVVGKWKDPEFHKFLLKWKDK